MAGPNIEVNLHFTHDPRLYVRHHKKFLRAAFVKAAEYHHVHHIPRHFQSFAAAKYRYKRRTSRVWVGIFEALGRFPWREGEKRRQPYQALKDRLGMPPLVFTGASRESVKTGRITATPKGSTLHLRLALKGASGRFRFKAGQTHLTQQQREVVERIAELQTIAPDEQRTINALIQNVYNAQANAPGVPYRKRVVAAQNRTA